MMIHIAGAADEDVDMKNGLVNRDGFAVAAVFLSALMFGLEISSIPVILPLLSDRLGGEFSALQWIVNAYTIASVIILIAAGVLADRYGRRRVFAGAVVAFGLTSLLCGLAPDVSVLIAGRFLQGVAAGAMLTGGLAILSQQFHEGRERAKAFGLWGIGLGFGLGFGPIIGGGLAATVGWRWVFLVHVVVAPIAFVFIAMGVRESRDPAPGKLDIPGLATLSIALFSLVFYIIQGATAGFTSVPELVVLGIAVMGFIAFVVIELRSGQPMVPLSLFRIRRFSGALLGAVGMNFSFWPLIVYLPVYLETGLGYDVEIAAALLLGYTLPTFVLPPVAERMALRFGPARMIPIGLGVIGGGLLLIHLGTAVSHPNWTTVLPGLVIAGIGLGLTNTPVTNTTTASVPPARAGLASGTDMTARLTFLAINVAIMGSLFTTGIANSLRTNMPGLTESQLVDLAQRVAGGADPASLATTATGSLISHDVLDGPVTSAVDQGFGSLVLYGAIAVLALAVASRLVFGRSTHDRAPDVMGDVVVTAK
jgi:EmrB/QacA subfamily drug resistance transporter